MKKKHKKKDKNRKDKIYVGAHVEICNTDHKGFNGWRGIVKTVNSASQSGEYGVRLLWDRSGSSVNHYHGFPRNKLTIVKIRKEKA